MKVRFFNIASGLILSLLFIQEVFAGAVRHPVFLSQSRLWTLVDGKFTNDATKHDWSTDFEKDRFLTISRWSPDETAAVLHAERGRTVSRNRQGYYLVDLYGEKFKWLTDKLSTSLFSPNAEFLAVLESKSNRYQICIHSVRNLLAPKKCFWDEESWPELLWSSDNRLFAVYRFSNETAVSVFDVNGKLLDFMRFKGWNRLFRAGEKIVALSNYGKITVLDENNSVVLESRSLFGQKEDIRRNVGIDPSGKNLFFLKVTYDYFRIISLEKGTSSTWRPFPNRPSYSTVTAFRWMGDRLQVALHHYLGKNQFETVINTYFEDKIHEVTVPGRLSQWGNDYKGTFYSTYLDDKRRSQTQFFPELTLSP